MNAYELADELNGRLDHKAANMLRQQADRIERKQELIREQTALLVKQNNRIAELSKNVDELEEELLKTPQIKELSDDEIIQTACDAFYGLIKKDERPNFVRFARAILKKASEK